MSLNYDISGVKNWRHKLKSKNGQVLFETLLYTFMVIGVNRITEDGIDEIEERLIRYQRIFGPLISRTNKSKQRVPVTITQIDLRKWLGMKTNIRSMPDAEFDRHIRMLARKHKQELKRTNQCSNI